MPAASERRTEPSDSSQTQSQRPTKRPRVVAACLRCKTRRQKCDNQLPACSNCARAKLNCEFPENEYPSSYVKALESRVAWLETQLNPSQSSQSWSHLSTDEGQAVAVRPEGESTANIPGTSPGTAAPYLADSVGLLSLHAGGADPQYFGVSSGVSLARMIETAVYENAAPSSNFGLSANMPESPFHGSGSGAQTKSAPLPSLENGQSFIKAYLSYIQPSFPFLSKRKLWEAHQKSKELEESADEEARYSYSEIQLVHAIGSRCSQLVGSTNTSGFDPEHYYNSAMTRIQDQLNSPRIQNIRIILLVAIYALRSPSKSSVWHLCCLMIRQCVELGFHRQPRSDNKIAHSDEFKKRLFWSIYQLERRTALVLGRPFAIDDDEIDISWPEYIEDDDFDGSFGPRRIDHEAITLNSNSAPRQVPSKAQADISFHSLCITIDQLNAKSRLTLCRLAKASPEEKIERKITKRFQKLEDWKTSIFESRVGNNLTIDSSKLMYFAHRTPVQTPASTPALTERQRLTLLLNYHRARRLLLQTILTDIRLPNQSFPYSSFAKSSGEVCQLNRRLHRLTPVPFTLLDLHSVFVAGFSMVYCAWSEPQLYDAEMAADFGACSTVLYLIAEQWGDGAKKYRDAFELVAEKTAEHVLSLKQSRQTTERQQHQSLAIAQQNHLGNSNVTSGNNFANGTHLQGSHYDSHRAEGEELGSESVDLWQMISQSWPAHDYNLGYDTVDFASMEELLMEEGLGWLNGGTSF